MALTKLVNGKRVRMSAVEETAILATWNSWIPPVPPTRADRAENAVRSNPVFLALERIRTGDNTLTEDALVVSVRSRLL